MGGECSTSIFNKKIVPVKCVVLETIPLSTDETIKVMTQLSLLFLTFSIRFANPEKLLHGGQSRSCLLNRENRTKRESLAAHPLLPPPLTLLVLLYHTVVRRKQNKIKRMQAHYCRAVDVAVVQNRHVLRI